MDKALQLLGLAYKAGKIVLGDEILKQIRKIKLLIIASDISPKSKERVEKKCYYYQIETLNCFNGTELSSALGKNNIKLIGITDEGFKKALLEKINKGG